MKRIEVVTSVIKFKDKLLIVKRSQKVGSYRGFYSGISGYLPAGKPPHEWALQEILEETGLTANNLKFLEELPPLERPTPEAIWIIHPFLFETDTTEITLDWEADEGLWIEPREMENFQTVPDLPKIVRAFGKHF